MVLVLTSDADCYLLRDVVSLWMSVKFMFIADNPFRPSQVDCDDNNYFYHYNDNTTWPKRFIYLCQTVSFVSVELLCTTIYA